jgi:hypothetical protein
MNVPRSLIKHDTVMRGVWVRLVTIPTRIETPVRIGTSRRDPQPIGTLLRNLKSHIVIETASVVLWSEFLAANPEVPSSIPDATRFSE